MEHLKYLLAIQIGATSSLYSRGLNREALLDSADCEPARRLLRIILPLYHPDARNWRQTKGKGPKAVDFRLGPHHVRRTRLLLAVRPRLARRLPSCNTLNDTMGMSRGRIHREDVGTEHEDPLGTGRGHTVVCEDRDGEAKTSSSLCSTPPVYICEDAFLTVTGETISMCQ